MFREEDHIIELLDDLALDGELLVMLKIYMDLGQKSDPADEVITVAAALFDRNQYLKFTEPWNEWLEAWPARAFHAKDFYPGARHFNRKRPDGTDDVDRIELYKRHSEVVPVMVGTHATHVIGVAFRPREYMQMASAEFKERYGTSLHSIATQILLLLLGWWAKDAGHTSGFACFMEGGDKDEAKVLETITNMQNDEVTGAHIQVHSKASISKGSARGLEAADFIAWQWNKYYMDTMREGLIKKRPPRRDFSSLVTHAENKHYFTLITGDKLEYFLTGSPLGIAAVSSERVAFLSELAKRAGEPE